jgi:four helix bundle protein
MNRHNFKELKVWQKARVMVKDIYTITMSFPDTEKYGLISQIRRSAVSIPSNIAEGSGKSSNKDFARFLEISLSSSYELETQLIIAMDLSFVQENQVHSLLEDLAEIQKMIFGLQSKLNS